MANRRGKVLVTGGAGFIGSHLVERLVREGLGVRVLDDFSSGRAENLAGVSSCIELISGSILNPELLERAAEGCGCIFHLAAVVSVPRSIAEPDRVHEVNATGTLAVIEAAMGGAKYPVKRLQPPATSGLLSHLISVHAAACRSGELPVGTIRLAPPLMVTEEDLDWAIDRVEEIIR